MVVSAGPGMRILRATHLGMCFGVRDAIALALSGGRRPARQSSVIWSITRTVLSSPRGQGHRGRAGRRAVETSRPLRTPRRPDGTSERSLARSCALGLTVVEATRPLGAGRQAGGRGPRALRLPRRHRRAARPRGGARPHRRSHSYCFRRSRSTGRTLSRSRSTPHRGRGSDHAGD